MRESINGEPLHLPTQNNLFSFMLPVLPYLLTCSKFLKETTFLVPYK